MIEVCHTFGYGPPQALAEFLRKHTDTLLYVGLPLSYSKDQHPTLITYHLGEQICKEQKTVIKAPEMLLFLRDFFLTVILMLRSKSRYDVYIGVDCLNTFAGLLLRKLGRVRRVVFYAIDYIPNRFSNPLLNLIYHFLDVTASQGADSVWNLSPVMARARLRLKIDSRRNLTVPTGAHFTEIQRVPPHLLRRRTLVWSGRMEPWSGLDIIVDSLPQIIAKVHDLKVILIGDGPLMSYVERRVEELKLQDHVELTRWVPHQRVLEIVPKCGVAVALLTPDPINMYTDMIKIKEYLACGCPVIITMVPDIAYEIRSEEAGIAIHYTTEEFVQAVVKIMTDDAFFESCRTNAVRLGEKYDWTRIFTEAFQNTLKLSAKDNR